MNTTEETITIKRSRYLSLLEADRMLRALEAAGVDNWEGYDEALENVEEAEEA